MKDLVPIKVKIGLRPNSHADHPDWMKLPLASKEDPGSHMFFGWKYDKTSGHKEETAASPYGMQWGMVFVTPQFAKEAKETFPDLVTELTEEEAEEFYDTNVTAHIPENKADVNTLQALQAELALRKELDQAEEVTALKIKIKKALDPNDAEPGLRKVKDKKFSDAKTHFGFRITSTKSIDKIE